MPAAEVEAPGVEYVVEVLTEEQQIGLAVGSPQAPQVVVVEAPASAVFFDRRHRSRVSLSASALDFGTFDDRPCPAAVPECTKDTMFVFEADLPYRLCTRLYGVRVGFGVLDGAGGSKTVRADGDPPEAAFNYGYTELEFASARARRWRSAASPVKAKRACASASRPRCAWAAKRTPT